MDAGAGTPPRRCLNAFQSKRLWKIPGLNGIRCITSTEMLLGQHLRSRRLNGNLLDVSKRHWEAKEIISNTTQPGDISVNRLQEKERPNIEDLKIQRPHKEESRVVRDGKASQAMERKKQSECFIMSNSCSPLVLPQSQL